MGKICNQFGFIFAPGRRGLPRTTPGEQISFASAVATVRQFLPNFKCQKGPPCFGYDLPRYLAVTSWVGIFDFGQCTHLASCLFQATEIWGLSFADLVHWHQVAGGCQDGYQPRPSQPALVFSHHQFKSPPPPVPARKPGCICGSGGHDLRMEQQLKVAFHTVSSGII